MAIRRLPDQGPAGDEPPPYERVPPHNIEAEESVLGSMLLSKDAIAEVLELLHSEDFYRPAHRTVFDAILEMYARGDAVDAVTVAEHLRRGGVLADIGGAPFLFTLVSGVPTAANAGYYARIVKEAGTLRRLIDVGTRIVQLGFETPQDVERAVDVAEALVYQIAQGRFGEDYQSLRDVLTDTLEAIERLHDDHRELTGIPTGFPELDRLTSGLQNSNLVIVAARPAVGKCLAAETLVTEAASGARLPIHEVVRRGQAGEELLVHTLGDDGRLRAVRPSAFLDNGIQPVLRLVTGSGRTLRATPTHPLRTPGGWVPLQRLRRGDRLAVPAAWPLRGGGDPDPRGEPVAVGATAAAATAGAPGARAVPPAGQAPRDAVSWDEVLDVRPDGLARVYDLTVAGTHNFVAGDMVVHNSTLGLDIARNAAVRAAVPTVVFSLEMSKTELVQRLMCAECTVDMQRLRTGRMDESDWTRLTRSLGRLADAPLFIDDSASTTMLEIRAKCRRLKQRHGLGLVVVDYLQLMQSTRRVENRQQEVSEISRSMKLLAKELAVPVIAISQLSRQPESRSDRRPLLSDLRESGCLTADTRITRADTGAEVSLGELLVGGERDIPVWTLDGDLRLVRGTMTHVFPSGIKPVFELRLASGRHVKASANHPFRVLDGWRPLADLAVGDRLAVPRVVPEPSDRTAWPRAAPGRARLAGVATVLDDDRVMSLATSDVSWDSVVAIEPLGDQPVYDATVLGTHNFVANGIVVHNSLEQDADVVLFIYRDELYDQESPRKGEADLILAKHRNGPTDTVVVTFQGQYSRFAPMAARSL
jgi:replicative DNA helicase